MPDGEEIDLSDEYLKGLGIFEQIHKLAPADLEHSTDPARPPAVAPPAAAVNAVPPLYNFEDRHNNTFQLSMEEIKSMLRDDPNDGLPPGGLWAQDIEAYEARYAAQCQLNRQGF